MIPVVSHCRPLQDVSCNELQALPAQVGRLQALRELNIRRNCLHMLPEGRSFFVDNVNNQVCIIFKPLLCQVRSMSITQKYHKDIEIWYIMDTGFDFDLLYLWSDIKVIVTKQNICFSKSE